MAGHSHAKNVMHKKNAQDSKKAKVYVRISKIISVAVKLGGSTNPELNSKLKQALKLAQAQNVPKHVIEKAIEKNNNKNCEELLYEAFLGQIGILIKVNTDNKNRSASIIREIVAKNGGKMANLNSVLFLFKEQSVVECEISKEQENEFIEDAIIQNATEVEENIAFFELADFYKAQTELEKKYKITNLSIDYFANELIEVDEKKQEELNKLINALEEYEEVENCWHNCSI